MSIRTILNNLETKVENLGVGKLKTVLVDVKKLRDFVDNEVVENVKFNVLETKLNNSDKKNLDATALSHIYQFKTDKQNLEKKIRDVDKKYQTLVV